MQAIGRMPGWELRPPELLKNEVRKIGLDAFNKGFRQLGDITKVSQSPFRKKRTRARPVSYVTEKQKKEQAVKDKAAAAIKAKQELARRDLVHFMEYVFRTEDGFKITAAPHQKAWWDHVKYCWEIDKVSAILSPMSFAKTGWFALGAVLWLLGKNPNLRITLVSSAEDIAAKRLQEVARYIKESKQYQEVFPWVKPDYSRSWNYQNLNIVREVRAGADGYVSSIDHSVSAFGYKAQAGNGTRADVTIFDDVASQMNSEGEADRNTLFRFVTTQWLTRGSKKPIIDREGNQISPSPIVIFIGTRYNIEDIYASLPMVSQEAYCTLIQAVSDDFTHLDFEILGALEEPEHPLIKQYGKWTPPEILAA